MSAKKKEVEAVEPEIILVGNPNVGKSVLFGKLSGKYAVVSNYPGTSVSYSKGMLQYKGNNHNLIDTPGASSLFPRSEDEKVTRNVILRKPQSHLIQVVDAKNLRRALIMTRELLNLEHPLLICLNMSDEARSAGIEIDTAELSRIFGVRVIETVAITGKGIGQLKKTLEDKAPPQTTYTTWFSKDIEAIIEGLVDRYFRDIKGSRFYIEMMLIDDDEIFDNLKSLLSPKSLAALKLEYQHLKTAYPNLAAELNRQIIKRIDDIFTKVYRRVHPPEWNILKLLDRLSLYPLTGIPLAFGVLYLVFLFVGEIGAGTAVDYLEGVVFAEYLTPLVTTIVKTVLPIKFFVDLIVGEYGLFSMGIAYAVAIVLPIMITFFLAFGSLEDSGLLPRFTVLADRLFRLFGLTGKSVLPCLLGLGCGTMACLATRILETKKERTIATLLLALGIPCSAQLGVMIALAAKVSPYALLIVMLIVFSQLVLVGYLASLVIPGKSSAFIIELPPLRIPQLKNVLLKTQHRVIWFFREAVPLFLIGTFILFVLDKTGGLVMVERGLRPIISGLLGLPAAATEPFILGFLRRDYGAAGLYNLARQGLLNRQQILVSLVVITLFVPCIANFLVMIKERGMKTALLIVCFITPYAILVGTILNLILNKIKIL